MLKKGPVWALGAMSGTSLDGVDVAVIESDGEQVFSFGTTSFRAYPDAERDLLRTALGQWDGKQVSAAAALVDQAHEAVIAPLLAKAPEIAVVGYHGQTLAHDPHGRGTLQAGDGAWLAARLGCRVVWDFRSADVRLGGEGAPLAPFYHFALARTLGARAPVAFLNLGGVGNLTWIDPTKPAPETPGALVAFDTGPANAPIDDLMRLRRGVPHDAGGALAASGQVDEQVVERFLAHGYFLKIPPKSLDRDAWVWLIEAVAGLSDADAVATLTACSAAAVMRGMEHCPQPPSRVLVCGGGRHNATLMAMLAAALDPPVLAVEEVGLDGDMIEAQAFAHLAVRVMRGMPTSCPATTGVRAAVGGAIVSGI